MGATSCSLTEFVKRFIPQRYEKASSGKHGLALLRRLPQAFHEFSIQFENRLSRPLEELFLVLRPWYVLPIIVVEVVRASLTIIPDGKDGFENGNVGCSGWFGWILGEPLAPI